MRYVTYLSIYVLSVILVMTSCTKQEFEGDPGTPVFMAEVPILNDEDFEVVAGDDLYYMFASHQELESSVVYSGLFGKEDICTESCAENFSIKIVQKNTVAKGKFPVREYDFYSIPKDGFKHNFSVESTDEEVLDWTTWRVGNENHSGQESISFSSNNDSAPHEEVQMIYDVPGQFIAQFERPILPKTVDCELDFKISRVVNEGIFLELTTASPFTFVNWSNGMSGSKIKLNFNTQSYSANVFDASGCQTKFIIHFKTQNITKDYSIGMNQESIMFSTPDNADRSVIIEYTDPVGDFYTTSIIGQIVPFDFKINSIEDYENNEQYDPTWKIDASFDCLLFGENGETKRVVDGKAVFAVSY